MSDLEFAMLMKKYRAFKNYTLVELSSATNLSLASLVKIEKTGRGYLRSKVAIAQALGFSEKEINSLLK